MSEHNYEYHIDIVTKRYFHGVDNYDMDLILDAIRKVRANTDELR